jgi:hypothetical protein
MDNANQVFQGVSTARALVFLGKAFETIVKEYPGSITQFRTYVQGPAQVLVIMAHVSDQQVNDDSLVIASQVTDGLWTISGHEILGDLLLDHFNNIFK